MTKKFLIEMTYEEARESFRQTDTALISTGSVEQHGPACALGLDTLCSWEVTQRVASLVDCVCAPPLPFGFARQWMDYPGTLTLRRNTFEAVVDDLCKSLIWHGSKRLVIINGHGRNTVILNDVALRLKYETGALVFHVDWWKIAGAAKSEIGLENPPSELPMGHASEVETSGLWAVGEKYIRPDKFVKEELPFPIFPGSTEIKTAPAETPISVSYEPFGTYQPGTGLNGPQHTRTGIVGSSKRASREKGERAFAIISERIAGFVREIQRIQVGDVRRPETSFY
jgi:creatinine amidohydrolase